MSRVLMVASEAEPFCKTGGLADVMGALPAALQELGEDVAIVLPGYSGLKLPAPAREAWRDLFVNVGPHRFRADIYQVQHRGVAYYIVDCPLLYGRPGIYGDAAGDFPDNHIRFAALSMAALQIVRVLFRPDVIHCHDWQASLLPVYLRGVFDGDPTYLGIRTLLTIHNLGYQGRFGGWFLSELGLGLDVFHRDGLEYYGDIDFLKGGIAYSDAVSTVSPNYAREIQTPEFGFGLDGFLRSRASKITGILNGVDYTQWNPETDSHIPRNYSAADLSGKRDCKRALLEEMGLPLNLDRPLIGIVSRFAFQKGFDLVEEIAAELSAEDAALVVLGSGEARFEQAFRYFASARPDRFAGRVGYDEALSHRIEAGSDMFLMPSRYEPCGLNQIYSLRYGTVPIVRATGGLDDTIEEATGFKFWDYAGWALLGAIRAALEAYRDQPRWREMVRRCMGKDFSWHVSAEAYKALFARLSG